MSLNRASLNRQPKALKAKGFQPARQLIANQQPKPKPSPAHARPPAPARARATPPAPLPPPPPAPARASLSAHPHGELCGKSDALRAGGRAENFTAPSPGRGRAGKFTPAENEAILAGRRASPPVTFDALAAMMGRAPSSVRRRASQLGCVNGDPGALPTPPKRAANPGLALKRRGPPGEALPERLCLRCRTAFTPPGRFYFLCDRHRGGDE